MQALVKLLRAGFYRTSKRFDCQSKGTPSEGMGCRIVYTNPGEELNWRGGVASEKKSKNMAEKTAKLLEEKSPHWQTVLASHCLKCTRTDKEKIAHHTCPVS